MKNNNYQPLSKEFGSPLDKIQRPWVRRPALIILTPIVLVCGVIGGVVELFYDIYRDCW